MTNLSKKSNILQVRITDKQLETIKILKSYDVNISHFIRLAIKEKIGRDWKSIKEKKERVKLPF